MYDLLFDPLVNSLKTFMLSQAETEDVLQEAFVRIFTKLHLFDAARANITTWATVVTRRVALNHIRVHKKFKTIAWEDAAMKEFLTLPEEHDFLADKILEQAIQELPGRCKEVFDLFIKEQLTHKEISEKLQISESSSRAYLARARKMLRDRLPDQGTSNFIMAI